MAGEIEEQSLEIKKSNEGSENKKSQKLDDATYEPHASVEETGDYRQSETIQKNFVAVMDNSTSPTTNSADRVTAGEAQPTALRQTGEQPRAEKVSSRVQAVGRMEGFSAVDAIFTGFRTIGNSGTGTERADNPGGSNTQTSGRGSDTDSSFAHAVGTPDITPDRPAGGSSYDDIVQGFYDHCKASNDNGNGPVGSDVGAWVAGQAAEYFGAMGLQGTDRLIGILQMLSKPMEDMGKTTVTRAGSDSGTNDEPGTNDDGNSDEPGTSGGSKGSSSGDNNSDSNSGTGNGGSSSGSSSGSSNSGNDEPGTDNPPGGDEPGADKSPGGDEPGAADGEDNSGHGRGVILKGGGSSGGGDEQNDSGHRAGVRGGTGSGSGSGGGDDGGDDSGHPSGKFGGGVGKILSDNQPGAVDPIGPANASDISGDKLNSGNIKNQTGKV